MALEGADLASMLLASAHLLQMDVDRFSKIDSLFGDGDHGVAMGRIAGCIEETVGSCDPATSEYDLLSDLGDRIMAVGGGSAGLLYGTMIGGMAAAFPDGLQHPAGQSGRSSVHHGVSGEDARAMLHAGFAAMREVTTADTGDKTMMDALIPAVEAADRTQGDAGAVFRAAASAAQEGAKATEHMVSRFGRARFYGEKTLGTPDAGASSMAVFLKGLSVPFS